MSRLDKEYNGWKNYATWNVALWIQNTEAYYRLAISFKDGILSEQKGCYKRFILGVRFMHGPIVGGLSDQPKLLETRDGVLWLDDSLDYTALDYMVYTMAHVDRILGEEG